MGKHYKEKKKNKVFSVIFSIILSFILIAILIFSGIKIINWYLNNKENGEIQKEISKSITINEDKENVEDKYKVDFNRLKEKNSDAVAWLKVNGTKIEYVVVKTNDNNYYLTHNYEKKYSVAGWIFADYKNKFDGTDKNIVIYGHNMKNNSMFGSLKDVIKEEWYNNEDNYKIILITENETIVYEVFSVYQIEKEDYYIQTYFKDDETFEKFVKTIKERSVKDFNTNITKEDSILTLSTCANNNKYRIVLHAKKIEN